MSAEIITVTQYSFKEGGFEEPDIIKTCNDFRMFTPSSLNTQGPDKNIIAENHEELRDLYHREPEKRRRSTPFPRTWSQSR